MAILVDRDTRVLVQGITGEIATFYTARMIEYGTRIVGGVTPEKGGTEHLGLPVFDTVREAVEQTRAQASIVFVPPAFAADSIMEAADAGLGLCVCVSSGIPAQDMIRVKRYIRGFDESCRMLLAGPNSSGIISPGMSLLGIMPGYLYQPGSIGIISRSGTLGFEAASQLKAAGIGVSTSIGIGGDTIIGSTFLDHLQKFEADPDTTAIIMIGEIGGLQEIEGAGFFRDHMKKPVIGYIAGLTAPKGTRMGHAGAIIKSYGESAAEKVEMLRECDVTVVPDPSSFAETVKDVLGKNDKRSKRAR